MKRCGRGFICIGFIVALSCVFGVNSWAGPFEYLGGYGGGQAWVGYYSEIEGQGYIPYDHMPLEFNFVDGVFSIHDSRNIQHYIGYAARYGNPTWDVGYYLTDQGFNIFSDMTLATSYSYDDGFEPIDPGYSYAFSGADGYWFQDRVKLTSTAQAPLGTVIPFAIQTETSGTPWAICEWELNFGGVTVNQDNYDLFVFNLVVGEEYYLFFSPGNNPSSAGGFQTQSLVSGSLESGFNLNFVQVSPVPIPGAIWLLGSGLVGLIGLRRKYFS